MLQCASQIVLVVKNLPANAGVVRDATLISGSGRSLQEGPGNSLQYYCLEDSMNRGSWQATVHRVAKRWAWLKWLIMHTSRMQKMISDMQQRLHSFAVIVVFPIAWSNTSKEKGKGTDCQLDLLSRQARQAGEGSYIMCGSLESAWDSLSVC